MCYTYIRETCIESLDLSKNNTIVSLLPSGPQISSPFPFVDTPFANFNLVGSAAFAPLYLLERCEADLMNSSE